VRAALAAGCAAIAALLVLTGAQASPTTAAAPSRPPVVLIIFDEFSLFSLMDRSLRIDPVRYPNFAALSRDSTWYRNATTVVAHTSTAVPALLTGQLPTPGKKPVLADYPRNLFTFLGANGYRIRAIETLTHMCPDRLCTRSTGPAFDVGDYTQGKPAQTVPPCRREICHFTSLIAGGGAPAFYYLHAILPHGSYIFLPSGKRYVGNVRIVPGGIAGRWTKNPWLPLLAYERYLLQIGYTDRALGLIVHTLRDAGIWDRALVFVTSDNGLSFRPGRSRRNVTPAVLADVAFAPLFVKYPGQRQGRTDDSFVQTLDIVPTIASILHIRLPWQPAGKPLVGRTLPKDGTVTLYTLTGQPVRSDLRSLLEQRKREVAAKTAVFGTGSFDHVYALGPHRELLGRRVTSLPVRPSAGAGVQLDGRALLGAVDLAMDWLPSYLQGRITGEHPPVQDLAIAVNGTIRALAQSHTDHGLTRFSTLAPEWSLRQGANDVRIYAVVGTAARPTLEELPSSEVTYTLSTGSIQSSDGKTLAVRPGALLGEVRPRLGAKPPEIGGWAADGKAHRAVDRVAVFVDGRSVYAGLTGNIARTDIRDRYGVDTAGFIFQLPAGLLPAPGSGHMVRVFALEGGVASELRYLPGWPWATR
jgi:hypothetical protein